MQFVTLLIIGFLIMLAVLGHGAWHHGEIEFANAMVAAFTGGHVTG
jgi:hypothetical protein